jgi:hypothetical protein
VVVKRGYVNTHYYYIPIFKVRGWDGNVLWINGTEGEIKANYEIDRVPDPTLYYLKDYPYYNPAYLPDISMIPARYRPTLYPTQALLDLMSPVYTNVICVIVHLRMMMN